MESWTLTSPPLLTPTLNLASPFGRHCCNSAGLALSSKTRTRLTGASSDGDRTVTSMTMKNKFGSRWRSLNLVSKEIIRSRQVVWEERETVLYSMSGRRRRRNTLTGIWKIDQKIWLFWFLCISICTYRWDWTNFYFMTESKTNFEGNFELFWAQIFIDGDFYWWNWRWWDTRWFLTSRPCAWINVSLRIECLFREHR